MQPVVNTSCVCEIAERVLPLFEKVYFESTDFLIEFVDVGNVRFFLGASVFEDDIGSLEQLCIPACKKYKKPSISRGGTRTRTTLRSRDFKSLASAIPPLGQATCQQCNNNIPFLQEQWIKLSNSLKIRCSKRLHVTLLMTSATTVRKRDHRFRGYQSPFCQPLDSSSSCPLQVLPHSTPAAPLSQTPLVRATSPPH